MSDDILDRVLHELRDGKTLTAAQLVTLLGDVSLVDLSATVHHASDQGKLQRIRGVGPLGGYGYAIPKEK